MSNLERLLLLSLIGGLMWVNWADRSAFLKVIREQKEVICLQAEILKEVQKERDRLEEDVRKWHKRNWKERR